MSANSNICKSRVSCEDKVKFRLDDLGCSIPVFLIFLSLTTTEVDATLDSLYIGFSFFFGSGVDFLSFLVPFALYLQQFGTRICHFAWYLLHFGMVTLHCAWHLLHLAMFAFHFAWCLPCFGTSTSHLRGICYILVLQTFMWVSWEFL